MSLKLIWVIFSMTLGNAGKGQDIVYDSHAWQTFDNTIHVPAMEVCAILLLPLHCSRQGRRK